VRLRCATTNPGKLREFRLASGDLEIEPVPNLAAIPAPEETGATFEENAILKAVYYSRFTPDPVFADDSGLETDALGGAPGVLSARFAGPAATDGDNNRLLLEKLAGARTRAARFVCVIALAQQRKLIATFRGMVEGTIGEAPRGANGFGYDPLFYYAPFGCTFGEVERERKLEVSHRGQAIRALVTYCRGAAFR
jgi:XTP/dITP diphosphohydrolase